MIRKVHSLRHVALSLLLPLSLSLSLSLSLFLSHHHHHHHHHHLASLPVVTSQLRLTPISRAAPIFADCAAKYIHTYIHTYMPMPVSYENNTGSIPKTRAPPVSVSDEAHGEISPLSPLLSSPLLSSNHQPFFSFLSIQHHLRILLIFLPSIFQPIGPLSRPSSMQSVTGVDSKAGSLLAKQPALMQPAAMQPNFSQLRAKSAREKWGYARPG